MCLPYIIAEYEPAPKPKAAPKPVVELRQPACRQPPASCTTTVLAQPGAPRPVRYVACSSDTDLRCPIPTECVGREEWLAFLVGAQRGRGGNGGGGGGNGGSGGNRNGNGDTRRRRSSSASSSVVSVKSFKEVKRKVGVLWEQVAGLEREKERKKVEREVREEVGRERIRVREEREREAREERERKEREEREREARALERERRGLEREMLLERFRERRRLEGERRWDDGGRRGPWHGNEQMWRRW